MSKRYLVISLLVLFAVLLVPTVMFFANGGFHELAEGVSKVWTAGYLWAT